MDVRKGLCQCGCGQKTKIATRTSARDGHVKGEPLRFIYQHHHKREKHWHWGGGKIVNSRGYTCVYLPLHYRADSRGYVIEHLLIAEKAFGKKLPLKAVVHHHSPTDLVICQDQAYHLLIHQRMRALKSCGNANWRKCHYCKQYHDPAEMYIQPSGGTAWKNSCRRERRKVNVSAT